MTHNVMLTIRRSGWLLLVIGCLTDVLSAEIGSEGRVRRFQLMDVFELEYASEPRISPDGAQVVFLRNTMNIMTDRRHARLWSVDFDGDSLRPLLISKGSVSWPRWSPSGDRLVYALQENESTQLFIRWMDTGQTAKLTQLTHTPSDLTWSSDGKWIAFSMLVPDKSEAFVTLPEKPQGARWAPSARVIQKLRYRFDGQGYLEEGYHHVFVIPAEGGTPRQVTHGPFDHQGPMAWNQDASELIISANRHEDALKDPLNTELYRVQVQDTTISALTDRQGPDQSPSVSPDGKSIVYSGFDDQRKGYHVERLYLMNNDGSGSRVLTEKFDRDAMNPVWHADGQGVYFKYDDHGDTKIGSVSLQGKVKLVASSLGGEVIGRPYAGGSFSVSGKRLAFTRTGAYRPADVAVKVVDSSARLLTRLNEDAFVDTTLGTVEEIQYRSSHDRHLIQGWVVKPPGFDKENKYPFILEIHGGPFANYGLRFSAEIQLYAAAGFVVLYANPRGSTGYGDAFANLIHHDYPGHDVDDLMSGVDAVIAQGCIDTDNLFITGGSGGGVLSSWMIGKTNRFHAAVVAKPVINWYSFALTSDIYNYFYQYWFPGLPWENPEIYLRRSPISLVGQVTTPTMLLTGEQDYRTPISETEQFYQALKLRGIETVMVRLPGASHAIAARPSHLISKVAHILKWFDLHRSRK